MKYNQPIRGSLLDHNAGRIFASPKKYGRDEALKEAVSKAVAEIEAVFADTEKKFEAAKRTDEAVAA